MSARNENYATPESFRLLTIGDNDCEGNDYSLTCIADGEIGTIVFKNGRTTDLTGIELSFGIEFLGNFESVEIISGTFVMYEN